MAACSHSGVRRDAAAYGIASGGRLEAAVQSGPSFDLQVFRRNGPAPGPLVVYIEGDGAAYVDRRTPSADPTPTDPVALRLAAADSGPAVSYIARPCQFAPGRADTRCDTRYWTTHRFNAAIVDAISHAIDIERDQNRGRPLVLVGYSGGGVVAALVTARRRDVALLVTIASPLDLVQWIGRMRLSALDGGSPLEHASTLARVPQIAFAGARDTSVPAETIASAIRAFGPGAALVVLPEFDHSCCWAREWPELRRQISQALDPAAVTANPRP